MDVRLEGPITEAAAVRSCVYSFVSRRAETGGTAESDFFSVTLIPTGDAFVCDLRFPDPKSAAAFLAHLPVALRRNVMTTKGSPPPATLLGATAG
jgi:hypothetical protein